MLTVGFGVGVSQGATLASNPADSPNSALLGPQCVPACALPTSSLRPALAFPFRLLLGADGCGDLARTDPKLNTWTAVQ